MCRNLSLEVNTLCGHLPKAITKTFDGRLNCTCIPSTEIDGLYTPWSEWSVCSDTCGNGVQIRSRSCTAPPPQEGGKDCVGPPDEVRECNMGPCANYFISSDEVTTTPISPSPRSVTLNNSAFNGPI